MKILKISARFFVRAMAACMPGKTRRQAWRDAGLMKIDEIFDGPGHLRSKERMLAASRGKKILVATHDLSVTGAPLALLLATKILIERGYSVFLVSFRAGPLRGEFENLGVTVTVGRFYDRGASAIRRISEGFDLMLANTIVCADWINKAALPPDKIMWWLHESEKVEELAEANPQIYKKNLLSAKNVYVVSDHARTFVEKYCPTEILHLGLEDVFDPSSCLINAGPRLRVAVVGTFSRLKNQKLVLKALDLMPPDGLGQLEIVFVGRQDTDYYESVTAEIRPEWPVVFTGEVADFAEKWRLFNSIDVFCVPSRDEACSLVVLEAFMLARPVIISDRVGAKYLLENGRNGLVFQNGNATELMKAMKWMIYHRARLEAMGQKARQVYLQEATSRQFEDRFMPIVDSLSA